LNSCCAKRAFSKWRVSVATMYYVNLGQS